MTQTHYTISLLALNSLEADNSIDIMTRSIGVIVGPGKEPWVSFQGPPYQII